MKILGIDDSVDTCDCCGKTGLMRTVAVEVNGNILHYGCVCATRHTGMSSAKIADAAKKAHAEKVANATAIYERTMEYIALTAKQNEARRGGLIGKPFKLFCETEIAAARTVRQAIAADHGLETL